MRIKQRTSHRHQLIFKQSNRRFSEIRDADNTLFSSAVHISLIKCVWFTLLCRWIDWSSPRKSTRILISWSQTEESFFHACWSSRGSWKRSSGQGMKKSSSTKWWLSYSSKVNITKMWHLCQQDIPRHPCTSRCRHTNKCQYLIPLIT